ncbi:CHAT domain-containing protein [Streptomyces sp. NPDC086549]|uniref:CHAT domain-containing protein n=1 Tax=Streptomyces sp. NPDC086549 TaxID=3365752 RepID=UPI00381A286B
MSEVVLAYLNAASRQERLRLLADRGDVLFSDAADEFIGLVIAQYAERGDEDAVADLRGLRLLLARCRDEGVERAHAAPEIPERVWGAVHRFVETQGMDEVRGIVEECSADLFDPVADRVFSFYLVQFRDDERIVQRVRERRDLLAVCRVRGTEVAFANQAATFPAVLVKAVYAFIDADTWPQARIVLEQNTDLLLSDDTDAFLSFAMEAAEAAQAAGQDNSLMPALVTSHLLVLRRCRTEGVDEVFAGLPDGDPVQDHELRQRFAEELARVGGRTGLVSAEQLEALLRAHPEFRQLALHDKRFPVLAVMPDRTRGDLSPILLELGTLTGQESVPRRVDLLRTALDLLVGRDPVHLWGVLQSELGSALSQLAGPDRAGYLEESIEHHRLADEVFSRGDFSSERALNRMNWANAYAKRVQGDRGSNIEQAIDCMADALDGVTRDGDPDTWAVRTSSLGSFYKHRVYGDPAENLDRSIELLDNALEVLTSTRHPWPWANARMALGLAYFLHPEGDRAENIEQAIECIKDALTVYTARNHPENWGRAQLNLAAAHLRRLVGDRDRNLRAGVEHCESALTALTADTFPELWAEAQVTLAALQAALDPRDGADAALSTHKAVLRTLSRDKFPGTWANHQANLASVLSTRRHGDRTANLREAVHRYTLALEVYRYDVEPHHWALIQHNLGTALANLASDDPDAADRAAGHLRQALEVRSAGAYPAERVETLETLGTLFFEQKRWEAALPPLTEAIELSETLVAEAYTPPGRETHVRGRAGTYAQAAFCRLRLGDERAALVQLERGKTRLLTEELALNDAATTGLSDAQAEVLHSSRAAVRELEAHMRRGITTPAGRITAPAGPPTHTGRLLAQARSALDAVVESIRAEHPGFMPGSLDAERIADLVPAGGALVAPLITSQGGVLLVVRSASEASATAASAAEVHTVDLPAMDSKALSRVLFGDRHVPGWLKPGDREQRMPIIDLWTRELWDLIGGPLRHHLDSMGLAPGAPVTILPQGGVSLLPLHAAWRTEGGARRYLLDDYAVSYAPSAYTLDVSRGRAAARSGAVPSLLAVADPTDDLRLARSEAMEIADFFPPRSRSILVGADATLRRVRATIPAHTHLHFACHGTYGWADPLESGLVLADERMTVRGLMAAETDLSSTRLVVLSACETGMSDFIEMPDEHLGLPAGFIQAGAPTVLSTLWDVDDLSTVLLMREFYRNLRDGHATVTALREAQFTVRDATVGELGVVEHWERVHAESDGSSRIARRAVDFYRERQTERLFTHPYYWAPFIVSGWAQLNSYDSV